jgi:CCR4-NOT transcription complex subunit 4
MVNCSHLIDVRVIQRDLVYIVAIPVQFANEDVLLKYEFFGQYGPIKKIVVNSTHIHSAPNQTPSVSAYVTFRNPEDALECIYSLESFSLDGNVLKASFGTTKYCSSFLRGQKCTNVDCMYLHHSGDQSDSFSKDEILGSCSRFVDMTRPSRPTDYGEFAKQDRRPTVLPARRLMKKLLAAAKKVEGTEQRRSSFLESIAEDEALAPIVVEDGCGRSLAAQFQLNRPCFRDVFNTVCMEGPNG